MKKNQMKVKRNLLLCSWLSFFLLISVLPGNASVFAQQEKLALSSTQLTVREIFDAISSQLRYDVFYNGEQLDLNRKVKFAQQVLNLEQVLDAVANNRFKYTLEDRTIILTPLTTPQTVNSVTLTGQVTDQSNTPLPGVTVLVKGTKLGTSTDPEGNFKLSLPQQENTILIFSFIGMESQEVPVGDPKKPIKVILKETAENLKEVVVTGIFTRKKESFTGSASTYTASELKTAGTQNILQSLKTLDPSFAILDNTLYGSDPNRLPNMEIRGKSSMLGMRDELEADPNQPLFILDGFESSLSVINDMDINRIASITILKDAASTAIYGSKAANGVVVVETVKPQAGKLMVSYNGNANISMPDLSSYNLMNAKEKLAFEKLAGKYTPASWSATSEFELQKLYNQKLAEIESGIDTYWLTEPLRVGVNQKHSLYIEGGEGSFLFGIGAGYNGISGVMEKSNREVISGNIDLIYRIKKFQFSNKFSMTNTKIKNPIVDFSEYAAANPYYKKRDEEGNIDKWLENNDYTKAANPLWNASQNSRDEGKQLALSNYFVAEYTPLEALKVRARFGISYGNDDTEKFISRNDTRFDTYEILKKGTFNTTNTRSNQYEGELSVTFAKLIGRHRLNAVLGGNLNSNKTLTQGYSAQGFPEGDFVYPSFSNGYPEGGSPTYYENTSRSMNGYFNLGYSFDDRYLMDFSLRENGSSVFGASKRYIGTWSVGLGWNLHKERFIADHLTWIDFLKLRASIGNPGNQNFSSSKTLTTFNFQLASMNYFGMGAVLNQLGNPDLDWQITLDKNIGIDMTLIDKRLNITADYYHKVTDPLLINISMPLSSGTSSYLTNMGKQISQGLTLSASYYIIQKLDQRFSWLVRGNLRTQKTKLDKIGNKLDELNKSGQGHNTVRYYNGADPDDIWAVKSAGIDPSTGRELFYDKEGNYTYDFSYDNEVICGNTRPKIEGVIGTSLNYKGFSVSMNFRYQTGASVFNEALFNKVENISVSGLNKNQDKRALYERWQNPGDKVRFKDIANAASTPMSSRFIQKENVLSMESVYVGYEFYEGWIKKIGLSNLKIQASMRDVFRASTIKSERGTLYPFARSLELGLSFNF
ncbi:SusC/RagA family TonB-linked outer membrane protein [Odoribacter splanchnicus]|jgi:tonB-linked outer membrane protein, susC/ragA family|uniref:SusC/RagA family TonB-linked outer membrane protein n=1 Tax=Odoribacter splanchnicus TaxID=28118 RepID=A0AAW6FJI1_9BACT|nr:SusC/RagA family TonB-linked outer membrane protein [Odoribacter splanchnicus]MDB9205717.1 SusC/RagA family TonB-linked outer membrane protein [Odoribacter splanchnicus]MDB9213246.1 SusC/RagA family TonB-linked outer membrane protein [Odoribacter splanchnicus]MDB9223072.1 SusC/RagA family TonB-linked outer membrane protein [Odoribacter splanchnicus]